MTRETHRHSGNGPDWKGFNEAVIFRRSITLDTNATFMAGHYHNYGCFYMPGVEETFKRTSTTESPIEDDSSVTDWMEGPEANSKLSDSEEQPLAVRNDVHQPGGQEIVVLRYLKLKKGSFDAFLEKTLKYVWPYQEKWCSAHRMLQMDKEWI
eukprot:TRINITY_DN5403_c0_g1_i1.p1 TRINITY_DN5403_c0_g1~~TRINITY_DN5403_c0_g1_i1.p1  ORF type:complete len:163 (+),score=18.84 TRINITY_DN5403_c0_g1_i1:31-489(+)